MVIHLQEGNVGENKTREAYHTARNVPGHTALRAD